MKYIKKFEKQLTSEEKERIGHYVIINPIHSNIRERNYFNNNIGKIVGININSIGHTNTFNIEYDKDSIPSYVISNKDNTYCAYNSEIILEYKDKEELESFIMARKFNI